MRAHLVVPCGTQHLTTRFRLCLALLQSASPTQISLSQRTRCTVPLTGHRYRHEFNLIFFYFPLTSVTCVMIYCNKNVSIKRKKTQCI
jgi:hypothetical protein